MMKNKITAPKKTTIKGQPHELAYINDAEQGLLMALGGAGKPVHGILAYYDEGDDYGGGGGDQSAGADGRQGAPDGGDRGNDRDDRVTSYEKAIIDQARDNLAKSIAEKGGGTDRNPMANSTMTAADFNFTTTPAAQRIAQSYLNGGGVFAPSVFSSRRIGGSLKNLFSGNPTFSGVFGIPSYSNYFDDPDVLSGINAGVQGQLDDRYAQAEKNYGIPGFVGAAMGGLGKFGIDRIRSVLDAGGRPVFDENGQLAGAFGKGLFGSEVYTGNPVKGMPETGYVDDYAAAGEDRQQTVPPNPMTGTCPDGYIFDDDLQACRLDTGSSADGDGDTMGSSAEGLMYRPTALDEAPAFGGDGFAEANKAFVDTFAYNPDYYENQMDLTGFAPTSGLLT